MQGIDTGSASFQDTENNCRNANLGSSWFDEDAVLSKNLSLI